MLPNLQNLDIASFGVNNGENGKQSVAPDSKINCVQTLSVKRVCNEPEKCDGNLKGCLYTAEIMLMDLCLHIILWKTLHQKDLHLETLQRVDSLLNRVEWIEMFQKAEEEKEDNMYINSLNFFSTHLESVAKNAGSLLSLLDPDSSSEDETMSEDETLSLCLLEYLRSRNICKNYFNSSCLNNFQDKKMKNEFYRRLHMYEEVFGNYCLQKRNRMASMGRFDSVLVCYDTEKNIPCGTLFFQTADTVGSRNWSDTKIMSRMEIFIMCPIQRLVHQKDKNVYASPTRAMLTYITDEHDWIRRPMMVEPLSPSGLGSKDWVATLLKIDPKLLLVECPGRPPLHRLPN